MSLFTPRFQVLSDLHLEAPISEPLYEAFPLHVKGSHIFLLGNIGQVLHDELFHFLRVLLSEMRGSRFFYVLGNNEPYRTTLRDAVARLRAFEEEARHQYGGRFIFLNRDRFDVGPNITILGCTLWSDVFPHQASEVSARITDLDEVKGIHDWSLTNHLEEHRKDRDWLNSQVRLLEEKEPQRQIIIATHHSPTFDPRAVEPVHQDSSVSSAFATDMSEDICWKSAAVKLWMFGHTHYNCGFRDEETGKLVVTNQRDYGCADVREVIMEQDAKGFSIITPSQATENPKPRKPRPEAAKPKPPAKLRRSLFDRAADRIPGVGRLRVVYSDMTSRS
ncbi:Metallo-dependent phosphatase-like protein [Nemania serpens]|nr:Metallo-dependent phosphatase-like protein [Nemania serpens]